MIALADLNVIAEKYGIELAVLQAVMQIEARRNGFVEGRPVILFERHIFYRQLKKQQLNADLLYAHYPSLVNPKPGGYIGGRYEYNRLMSAKKINEVAAIESASWGLFQIMGFHWSLLGYHSAQDFESCLSLDEYHQLDAFVRFISCKENRTMLNALRKKDFALFARLYNGPAHAKNRYVQKMESAYALFKAA